MGAGQSQNNSDPISAINVTPLVDVCLVLVIIFMVTAPMIAQNGINVNSVKKEVGPEAKSAAPANEPQVETIYIKLSPGLLELNGQVVDSASFPMRLKEALMPDPQRTVYINADGQVGYGEVIKILDVSRQCGAQRLAMMNDKEGLLERSLIFQKK